MVIPTEATTQEREWRNLAIGPYFVRDFSTSPLGAALEMTRSA